MKGFIFAAGIGSRLRPWTDHHPKALVPVGGKPMLQRVIENMLKAGINDIIINIHHMADQITDFIWSNDSFGANIIFSDETDCLLDTGGAIVKAAHIITGTEPILIHNADIFTDLDLSRLISRHIQSTGTDATLLTSHRQSSRQLIFDQDNTLKGWINNNTGKRIPEDLVINHNNDSLLSFNGIHIMTPTAIRWITDNNPICPFPIIPQYIAMSHKLSIKAYTPDFDYTWIDVGRPDSLKMAQTIASSH